MTDTAHLAPQLVLTWLDWLELFGHYLMMSLMSVGGAISTTSEMHRFLVDQHHWLSQEQFNQSVALAQAAPGPNVLFVALMGWHVGMNAGSTTAALFGVLVTHHNRELRPVRAFKQGMAPLVIALLTSTAWIMGGSAGGESDWRPCLLAIISGIVIWRTRLHLLWLLAGGALLGAYGLI